MITCQNLSIGGLSQSAVVPIKNLITWSEYPFKSLSTSVHNFFSSCSQTRTNERSEPRNVALSCRGNCNCVWIINGSCSQRR